jgi:hypothetical protein
MFLAFDWSNFRCLPVLFTVGVRDRSSGPGDPSTARLRPDWRSLSHTAVSRAIDNLMLQIIIYKAYSSS